MRNTGSAFRYKLKAAKWLFAMAVFLFVAKPFVGFSLTPANLTAAASILVKSFTKRKHDYIENSSFDMKTIQKRLADPVNQLFLLFSCLFCNISALVLDNIFRITAGFLERISRNLFSSPGAWLLDGQLTI